MIRGELVRAFGRNGGIPARSFKTSFKPWRCGTPITPPPESVLHQVRPHAQRGDVLLRRVVVHVAIFPAIAEVALVVVEADQPAFPDQAEALCGQAIVLVDLGKPCGKSNFWW
jgi:hypothetical protein